MKRLGVYPVDKVSFVWGDYPKVRGTGVIGISLTRSPSLVKMPHSSKAYPLGPHSGSEMAMKRETSRF